MPKPKNRIIEYRNYELPTYFPILLLSGDVWRISDVPSGRQHFHNCLEIGLCESDSGIMEFMDISYPFQKGDITIVASDISHTTYSSPGAASKWSYIFVDIEELLHPFFPLDAIANGDILQKLIHNYSAILQRRSYPDIFNLVFAIIDTLQKKDANYQISVRGLILSLLIKLMNIYKKAGDEASGVQMHENSLVIAPALDFVRKNYEQNFSINNLADICHLSPTHFRRIFTSIMSIGPLEYLNRTRIARASVLLRTTEKPILDVSEEVGYQSLSSFNRHFLRMMGESPKEWRKSMSYIRNQSVLKYTGWMVPPKDL